MLTQNVKDMLRQIVKAKRTNKEDCVLFINPNIYDAMKKAGVVVCWNEDHPGAIWVHRDICGLPVVIDPKEEIFSVIPQHEAIERISSIMF